MGAALSGGEPTPSAGVDSSDGESEEHGPSFGGSSRVEADHSGAESKVGAVVVVAASCFTPSPVNRRKLSRSTGNLPWVR